MSGHALRSHLIAMALAAATLGACAGTHPKRTPAKHAQKEQTSVWPVVERLAETRALSCFGKGEGAEYGTRIARTPVLAAPGGRFRAYAEGEALAFSEEYGPDPGCVNFSRLHLAEGARDFELVLALSPFAGLSGNSIRIVDWSPDGERLLVETELWAYGSEFDNPDVLVLHAARRYFEALDMAAALRQAFNRDCFLYWRAQGFLPDGAVVVETHPSGELYGPSCEERPSRWRLDERGDLGRLPAEAKIERYAREVGAAP
ncbi:MAG: hypothetical protein ACRD2Z_11755 [Thermoanaerobaculia bacterium]